MSLLRLVVCLTLLGSSLGFAQTPEEWTPYTPPANGGVTAPPLVPAPPPPPEVSPPPDAGSEKPPPPAEIIPRPPTSENPQEFSMAARLMFSPFSGTITGVMGLIIGSVPSALLAFPFCLGAENFEAPRCAIALGTGLALSYSGGVGLGIYFINNQMGGRGDLLATLLGSVAGVTVGASIAIATQSILGLILGLSVGPLVGAVTAYEISHALAVPSAKPTPQARSGFQMVPLVGTTPRGGILGGLAGRF